MNENILFICWNGSILSSCMLFNRQNLYKSISSWNILAIFEREPILAEKGLIIDKNENPTPRLK